MNGDGPRLDVERPGLVSCDADNLTDVETGVRPRRIVSARERDRTEEDVIAGLVDNAFRDG